MIPEVEMLEAKIVLDGDGGAVPAPPAVDVGFVPVQPTTTQIWVVWLQNTADEIKDTVVTAVQNVYDQVVDPILDLLPPYLPDVTPSPDTPDIPPTIDVAGAEEPPPPDLGLYYDVSIDEYSYPV